MKRGFLNQPKKGISQPKAAQAAPAAPQGAASTSKSENVDSSLSAISDRMKDLKIFPGTPTDILILQNDDSNNLEHGLSPDAPALYPGKTVVRPHRFDKSLPPSTYLKESWPSIHMFTVPVGEEPVTAVCTYPGAAAYVKRHQGFKLPVALEEGVKACWEMKEVAGRGRGLFATRDISPGDVIIADRPLVVYCSVPYDVKHPVFQGIATETVDANGISVFKSQRNATRDTYRIMPQTANRLGPDRRKAFFGLADVKSVNPIAWITKAEGIVRTNGLGFVLPGMPEGAQTGGVCEKISLANHSCLPNAHYYFNYVNFSYELRALNPIPANTEITVTYVDSYVPRAMRQSALSMDYNFTCTCIACTDSGVDKSLVDFGKAMAMTSELELQIHRDINRGPPGYAAVKVALVTLRKLFAQHSYLFTSDPVPPYASQCRMQLIERWARLEIAFNATPVEATRIAVEGIKLIEKMEPCPSSRRYRVLDAIIKGNKEELK